MAAYRNELPDSGLSGLSDVAVTVAVGVKSDGRREVLGMAIEPSQAEVFWTDFLRGLVRLGLHGVKLIISDAHEGIKASVSRVFSATWQRCRVDFSRNALAHAGKIGRPVVAAFIATVVAPRSTAAPPLPPQTIISGPRRAS